MSDCEVDKELIEGIFKCEICGLVVKDEDEADFDPYCSEECQEEAEANQITDGVEELMEE